MGEMRYVAFSPAASEAGFNPCDNGLFVDSPPGGPHLPLCSVIPVEATPW